MRKLYNNHHGFTLVELMITVVIIGILAAVAIPLYQGNVEKAKTAEADAGLGTIRTALRLYHAEYQAYPIVSGTKKVSTISGLNIDEADLEGTYFEGKKYKYKCSDGISYRIEVQGTGAQAGIKRQMDQDGVLTSF